MSVGTYFLFLYEVKSQRYLVWKERDRYVGFLLTKNSLWSSDGRPLGIRIEYLYLAKTKICNSQLTLKQKNHDDKTW